MPAKKLANTNSCSSKPAKNMEQYGEISHLTSYHSCVLRNCSLQLLSYHFEAQKVRQSTAHFRQQREEVKSLFLEV